MKEYAELGIETFIFSGYPHLEEAYRTAELLFPHLPLNNQKKHSSETANYVSPFGELIANTELRSPQRGFGPMKPTCQSLWLNSCSRGRFQLC